VVVEEDGFHGAPGAGRKGTGLTTRHYERRRKASVDGERGKGWKDGSYDWECVDMGRSSGLG
jgi:hypothetical protein